MIQTLDGAILFQLYRQFIALKEHISKAPIPHTFSFPKPIHVLKNNPIQ